MKSSSQNRLRFLVLTVCLFFSSNLFGQEPLPSPSPDSKEKKTKSKTKGIIEGRVVDGDGHPLANAEVFVFVVGVIGSNSKGVTTDESGRFRITNLRVGAYRVQVNLQGYILSPNDRPKPNDPPKIYRSGDSVNLTLIKGGVITGKVTDASGEPVVGVTVHAMSVQSEEPSETNFDVHIERRTDDRGIYRIYGLAEGRYVVFTGRGQYQTQPTVYEKDAPTFYPASTRDSASIVNVQNGTDTTGIDIRYRNERGFTVSGVIKNPTGAEVKYISLGLTDAVTNLQLSFGAVRDQEGTRSFEFKGMTEGEYKIRAQTSTNNAEFLSGVLRVTVKNADVTGLELKLMPLSSISGRMVLSEDPKMICENQGVGVLEEILLRVSDDKIRKTNIRPEAHSSSSISVGNEGEFTLGNITGGNYRLKTEIPNEDWFIQSIVRKSKEANPKTKPANTSSLIPELIALKDGEKLSDLNINLSNGAASLRGRIVPKTEGALVPLSLRLYLVPTEKERAEDTLRYAETKVENDGSFAVTNLASGRYWLIARIVKDDTANPRPLFWDNVTRNNLRKEAESANTILELKPCQSIKDYLLKF